MAHSGAAERKHLVRGLHAVGRVQRVAVVEIALLRQKAHRLTQHADSAETGIKKSNGQFLWQHRARLLKKEYNLL